MEYSVQKLAALAGISVRTLRFYDQIGLLKPSYIKENGYRSYRDEELLKLQQILFFRELDFTLSDIKRILNSPEFNKVTALEDQKKLINLEIKRLQGLTKTIDKTIKKLKGGEKMNNDEMFEGLTKTEIEQYKKEAREKYGNYEDRTKDWSKERFNKVFGEASQISIELVEQMELGKSIQDQEVQSIIARHFDMICKFWDCDYEKYKLLGEMYIADERFTKNIDKQKEGLAQFMSEAMGYYSDQNNK